MPHRHRPLTAWLGMLAIWLAVVTPLASQWRIAQAAAPDPVVCSTEHSTHPRSGTHGAGHALHLDACGYCSFFAHSPALGGPAGVPPVPVFLPVASVASPAGVAASVERYTRAYPRAPPGNA